MDPADDGTQEDEDINQSSRCEFLYLLTCMVKRI